MQRFLSLLFKVADCDLLKSAACHLAVACGSANWWSLQPPAAEVCIDLRRARKINVHLDHPLYLMTIAAMLYPPPSPAFLSGLTLAATTRRQWSTHERKLIR